MPRIHLLIIVTFLIFRAFNNFSTLTSDQTTAKFANYTAPNLQTTQHSMEKIGADSLMNTFWSVFIFDLLPASQPWFTAQSLTGAGLIPTKPNYRY